MMISAEAAVAARLLLRVQPPRLRPQVEHARGPRTRRSTAARFSSSLQTLSTFAQSRSPTWPLRSLSRGDPRALGDQPLGELGVRHLEREEGDRALVLDRDVLGDVGDEAGLAHARAGGEDDQVAGLKAAGDLVEVGRTPTGVPVTSALAGGELLEPVDLAREDLLEHVEVLGLLLVGDLKSSRSARLGELARLALAVVDGLLDLLRGREQAAQQRVLLDDPRVVARRCRRPGPSRRGSRRLAAADLLELALLGEQLGDGERVDRLAALVEALDRAEDDPVALAVEVLLGRAGRRGSPGSSPSRRPSGRRAPTPRPRGSGAGRGRSRLPSVCRFRGPERTRIRPAAARGSSKPQRRRDARQAFPLSRRAWS